MSCVGAGIVYVVQTSTFVYSFPKIGSQSGNNTDLANRSSFELNALHKSATINGDQDGFDVLEPSTSKIFIMLSFEIA